jgi:cytochrome c2
MCCGFIPLILANMAVNVDCATQSGRGRKFVRRVVGRPGIIATGVLLLLGLVGCSDKFDYERGASMTGGDPKTGKEKIVLHDCHSCHEIPGIPINRDAHGPSLKHWSRRSTIARKWPNTPESLEDFIEHPERMLHGTGMKNEMTMSSVKPANAKDIAAYLFSID